MTQILIDSGSKQDSTLRGDVICVGDKSMSKFSIIRSLCLSSGDAGINTNKLHSKPIEPRNSMLLYHYMHKGAPLPLGSSCQNIDFWTVNDAVLDDFFMHAESGVDQIRKKENVKPFAYMIVIEMPQVGSDCDEVFSTLQYWLMRVRNHIQLLCERIGKNKIDDLRKGNATYLRCVKSLKGTELLHFNHACNLDTNAFLPSDAAELFAVPVIVCACECEVAQADHPTSASGDSKSTKHRQLLQGQLRALCLEAGAALINIAMDDHISSCTSYKSSSRHVERLSQYISHRLFPESVLMDRPLAIIDEIDNVFVPAGLDTPDLISSSTNFDIKERFIPAELAKHVLEASRVQPTLAEDSASAYAISVDENAWLGDLQSYLAQTTSSVGGTKVISSESGTAEELTSPSSPQRGAHASLRTESDPSAEAVLRKAPSAVANKEDVADFFNSLLNSS